MMKKLFIYRSQYPSLWVLIKVYIYKFIGYDVMVWGDVRFPIDDVINIRFPPSDLCSDYQPRARKMLSDFFCKYESEFQGDKYRTNYLSKTADIAITDYYAFIKTVRSSIEQGDKVRFIGPRLLSSVYDDKLSGINVWVLLYYPFFVARLFLYFLRDFLLSVTSKKKISKSPIIYFRKKPYPDMGEFSYLSSVLNCGDKTVLMGVYPYTSRKASEYGIHYLNSISGSSFNFVLSFSETIVQSIKDFPFFLLKGVDHNIYKNYLFDSYRAKLVVGLSSKIIFGQLLDKPMYVLLSKYRMDSVKIVSMNESFRFPPNRSFDYNYLDKYYSMNKVDEEMQNVFGGGIQSFKQVEFFRKGDATGVTDDFIKEISLYSYVVVLATGQVFVEKSGYNFWAHEELESFILRSIELARKFNDVLFVAKEKKGEYKVIPDSIMSEFSSLDNVFVINSERPRYLKYNNFEAILDHSDLLISSAHISNTIWQAIARNKPAIAVNDIHPPTLLRKYKGYECDLLDLDETISYWMNQSKDDIFESTERLKEDFNIRNSNGLAQIASDLKMMLDDD